MERGCSESEVRSDGLSRTRYVRLRLRVSGVVSRDSEDDAPLAAHSRRLAVCVAFCSGSGVRRRTEGFSAPTHWGWATFTRIYENVRTLAGRPARRKSKSQFAF